MTTTDYIKYKNKQKKISVITCYDFWTAQIVEDSDIDTILVGDSLAMICHGYTSTIPADMSLMSLHTAAVRRGAPSKLIIADMPFLSHRKSIDSVLDSVNMLMKAGANAVKIEGLKGNDRDN